MMPKALRDYWAKKRAQKTGRRASPKKVVRTARKGKIAIAPIAGFLMGLGALIKFAYDGSTTDGTTAFRLDYFGRWMLYGLTGMAYSDADKKWSFNQAGLMGGLVPFIAFSAFGWGAHKLANKFGVNKSIPWVSI